MGSEAMMMAFQWPSSHPLRLFILSTLGEMGKFYYYFRMREGKRDETVVTRERIECACM